MKGYHFELSFEVRDYECDIQGVVNNAVYMNYLEHARHELLKAIGYDFAALNRENILPMVYKAELEYKKSLVSGDDFSVKIRVEKEGLLKAVFFQDIIKSNSDLILKAKITAVVIANGKPISPDQFLEPVYKLKQN
ncbi:MAG: acyl-CoA thioesterase [Bacteroidales bacterium]|nr:acyl-CoA thioesterase [Bacteroidales bacterium]